MRSILLHVALVGALLLPGCASRHQMAEEGSPAPDDPAVLSVANHTWSDVNIFILASTMRTRVASVTSQGTTEVRIPRDLLSYGTIQVRVERIGGGMPFVTPDLDVHAGQRVTLDVEEQASMSSWVVEKLNRW